MNTEANQKEPSNKLHVKSWEIEILISGGAFFSLYQLANNLSVLSLKLASIAPIIGSLGFVFAGIGMLSLYFAVHLTVRAFWLSLILLQKIYPQGINTATFRLAEPYQSATTGFNLEKRINYLDKLSGLVFSWGVTFAIMLVGLSLAFSVWLIPTFIIVRSQPELVKQGWWASIVNTILISLLIFYVDTIFYGFIRRVKVLAKIYYPIYTFWNTVTLGLLWRPSLQLIFTNVKNRWKATVFVLVSTIVIGLFGSDEGEFLSIVDMRKNNVDKIIVDEKVYLDKRVDESIGGSFIQSDVITDNYLKIFVYYNFWDDAMVDTLKTEKHFSRIIKISINDSIYASPTWVGLKRLNGNIGIQTVIDISHLEKKLHTLKIERLNDKTSDVIIPFWKQ